jgi:hypothetical protein
MHVVTSYYFCSQAVSRRLAQLAGEVAAAQQRSKSASGSGSGSATRAAAAATAKGGKAGGIGSVEHTLKVRLAAAAGTVSGKRVT